MTGIYLIKNKVNGKCYVGQTSRTFETRFNEHFRDLKNNKHLNSNGKPDKLQRAWNKYGEDNFTFDILEIVEDINLLNEKEKYWVDYYDSYYNGYNQTEGGEGTIGYKHTEETKKKISESVLGEKNPMYGKNHSGEKNPMYGKNHSEETKEKISNTLKGKMVGENHPLWIEITDEMIEDYKNRIRRCDFCSKYNVSRTIWNKMRKQLGA